MNKKATSSTLLLLILLGSANLAFLARADPAIIDVYNGQSIQTAVNAANLGDTIVVHPGIYQEMVIINKAITVIGLDATVETPGWVGFSIQAPATVSGFKIYPMADGQPHNAGIQFESPHYYGGVASNNEVFPGFAGCGIGVTGPSGITIKNNIVHSSSAGIATWEVTDIVVEGNTVESVGHGIVTGGPNTVIANNIVHSGVEGVGIHVYAKYIADEQGGNVKVKDNIVVSEKYGAEVYFAANCEVTGNTITVGEDAHCLLIAESSNIVVSGNTLNNPFSGGLARAITMGHCSNVLITNNKITAVEWGMTLGDFTSATITGNELTIGPRIIDGIHYATYGIILGGSSDCVISENHIWGAQYAGIWIDDSRDLTIKKNQMTSDSGGSVIGIRLATDVSNAIVSENTITGDFFFGIGSDNYANTNTYYKNIITNTRIYGIAGIGLSNSNWNTVSENTISNTQLGISLETSCNNQVINNVASNNEYGILLSRSSFNVIANNDVSGNRLGIYLQESSCNNEILGNTACHMKEQNGFGITLLWGSNQNTIEGNTVSDNGYGISLQYSCSNNLLAKNVASDNSNTGIIVERGCTSNIITENTVNGNAGSGILISESDDNIISKNILSNRGISTMFLSSCTITDNIVTEFGFPGQLSSGIELSYVQNTLVAGNTVTGKGGSDTFASIYVVHSDYNRIIENTATDSMFGIYLCYYCDNNILENNIVSSNSNSGIHLGFESNGNVVLGNSFINNWLGLYIGSFSNYNKIISNEISGGNMYGVSLVQMANFNTFLGNSICNNYNGVFLQDACSDNEILNNIISNNINIGLAIYSGSTSNDVVGNVISGNSIGIDADSGGNNVYHNNFLSNAIQARSSAINIWDDGYPSGGNYWSDYTGVDIKRGPNQDIVGSDGIGDTPYVIDFQNADRYPYCSRVPPIITITSPVDFGVYSIGSAKYSFSATATPEVASLSATVALLGGTPIPVSSGDTIPSSPGVYTLSVTATDIYGNSATRAVTFVVYDSSAGFVTGGGSIDSPLGAYKLDKSLAGKAQFAFVSKYQKGANVPSGNTQFMFKTAGLDFSSKSYEWLVVAGSKAQFKGVGTINGAGNYNFMIWAEDGGKTGVDAFRIRIWDAQTDVVVYDNGVNQPISQGNIIIHK